MGKMICVLIVLLVLVLLFWNKRSRFTFNNSQYQYGNPSIKREDDYYRCISRECGGNTHDYHCLEKCHLKSYRNGMLAPDVKDMVCSQYGNPDDYYRCLDTVYTDYKYP